MRYVSMHLFTLILLLAGAAQAATVTVNVTFDENDGSCSDGDCSLRDAVATAAPGDTVALAAGTYQLTVGGHITLDKPLTIAGAGARTTLISNTSTGDPRRIFQTEKGAVVTISDVTLTRGTPDVGEEGGAIRMLGGELTVKRCTITNNLSSVGSGIGNLGGVLTLLESTVSNNGTTINPGFGTGNGGGLYLEGGFTLIANSTISGNRVPSNQEGGGIYALDTELEVFNSTIAFNTAGKAGGLANRGLSKILISNAVISNNSPDDCSSGSPVGSGLNLDSDGSCGGFSLQNATAALVALADFGGPTDTHALGTGSAAMGAGDNAVCAAAPVNGIDQRGVTRPQGPRCDLGAFEVRVNRAPVCTGAAANPSTLTAPLLPPFPLAPIQIAGVTDPDGDPVTITVTSIFQDEPVSDLILGLSTSPDGTGVGTANPQVRRERQLLLVSNGRVYHIRFTASDGKGGSCNGNVKVSVPPLIGAAVDNGPNYNSTVP